MVRKLSLLLFLFSISLFSQDEKRLALVIGNANYDKGVLKNPVNDARLIASTLDSLDFDVILKENLATKRDMTAAIREFGSKRSEYDVAFVYYAGHGIQISGENFLLPTKEVFEEEFDIIDYGVSVQSIMRYLEAQTNEVNILILDACRDNPFESKWYKTRSLKGSGLAKIPAPTGSLIAFSTDSGQTAPDGEGENSQYTLSLVKNMKLENISIDQVFRNVRLEVLELTNGAQRPVENTQLVGNSFLLNKTFSINNSSTEEIINFSNDKLSKGEIKQVIEILNSAADLAAINNKFNDEVILRKKIIEDYSFNKLNDGLPRHFSLEIRNLDYQKISFDDFEKYFENEVFEIYTKNLEILLNFNENKNFNIEEKNYVTSLYFASFTCFEIVRNNYLPELGSIISFPKITIDKDNIKKNSLTLFWFLKNKHLKHRTNPFSNGRYLIKNYDDLNRILISKEKLIFDQFSSKIDIKENQTNTKLFNYTNEIYNDINFELKRSKIDLVLYSNTNNIDDKIDVFNNNFNEYENYFLNKDFELNNYINLTAYPWFSLTIQCFLNRLVFYSPDQNEIKFNRFYRLIENTIQYNKFIKNEIEVLNFDDKLKINEFNSFTKFSGFRPNAYYQLSSYLLSDNDEGKFNDAKKIILEIYDTHISSLTNLISIHKNLKDKNFKILENKNLLNDWEFFSHELLYELYFQYTSNSAFNNNIGDSTLREMMISYEREYKLNYVNQVWVIKYLDFIKNFEGGNGMIFHNFEILTSLKLFELLIDLNFGTIDDLLFLKYANLHVKLQFSSHTNFCFDPNTLLNDLNLIKEANLNSQNFLLNAYVNDLDKFFEKGSSYYYNCLEHYEKEELNMFF